MQLPRPLRIRPPAHLAEPVIHPAEQREHRPQTQHIMKMRHHIISVMQSHIHARVRQDHARHAARRKKKNKTDRPQHRRREPNRPAPHRRDPAENLDPRRHRDNQRRRLKIHPRVHAHPDREHMMRPDHAPHDADRDHRVDHPQIAEDRLARKCGNHMTHNPERRQNHHINLRMSEEPEQMLKQNRIAAARRIEEMRPEVAVGQKHRDRAAQHRQRQEQQKRRHQHRPHEQRHPMHRHSRRAHVENRHNEINRPQNRRCPRHMQRKNRQIHRRPRLSYRRRQRRVERPARAGAVAREDRRHQQNQRPRQKPERNVVQSRKRHVGRADHQRNEPVAEASDKRRHHQKEHHDKAVRRDQHIPELPRIRRQKRQNLQTRLLQLHSHHHRDRRADNAREQRQRQIERADVLVIR